MGKNFIDQYTLLHFAVGIMAYFWNISLEMTIYLHALYELIENTKLGMHVITNYITIWPGGKERADSIKNSIGDIIFCAVGWLLAKYMDDIGKLYKWY